VSNNITPYLAVDDARRAIEWYGEAFGASLVDDVIEMPDGRVGHASLTVFGSTIFLSDAHPEIGVVAPSSGNDVTLHVRVDDVDATVAAAEKCGADVTRRPSDTPHGRIGVVRDPFGHRWMLNSPVAPQA
jgi:uncharacterized glyoxalase superfamily protein PhnB